MSTDRGRQLYRHTRGEFAEGEIPPTGTAVQRARLRRKAAQGDNAAQQALAEYAKERNARIKAELDEATAKAARDT